MSLLKMVKSNALPLSLVSKRFIYIKGWFKVGFHDKATDYFHCSAKYEWVIDQLLGGA